MSKRIGIVGCSAEGAALCYKTICVEGARFLGRHAHPEVVMHTPSLSRYLACLERGDLAGVADLMLTSEAHLRDAGADFLICPDNTIHQAFGLMAERSSLPWLHIAEVVAEEAAARGFGCLGLMGTRWLVESEVYPESLRKHGIRLERPEEGDRAALDRIILDELVTSRFDPASIERLQAVTLALKDQRCDAVVLGCTELPLVLDDGNCALPTLDSTRLLARAALKHACEG